MSKLNVIQCDGCPVQCECGPDNDPPEGWLQFASNWTERQKPLALADWLQPLDLCPGCSSRLKTAIACALDQKTPAEGQTINESIETIEQRHILNVLNANRWNKSQSARILGIERSTLDRKLERYKVQRPAPAPAAQAGGSTL